MKKILQYCKPYALFMTFSLTIKTVGTLMDLVIPYLLGYILDEVVPRVHKEGLTPVFFWGGMMIFCAVLAFVANVVANRRTALFAKNVVQSIRADMFDKILSLSAAQTDAFTIPSLVARMSSDTYSIHNMLNTLFRGGFRAPILLLGGVGVTLFIEPVLSLAFIALLPLMFIMISFISKKGITLFKYKQNNVDTMVEKVRDTFTGIRVIKALSKVDHEKDSFQRINLALSRSEEKANITMGASRPIFSVFLNLGMTVMVALGAWRVHTGHTAPGQIISFMSYFTIILNATLMLTRIFTVYSRGAASADRIAHVLDEREDLICREKGSGKESEHYLEFRNVSFSYRGTGPILKNVSFSLEKGQTLGIIGGTGSGKSTLIQLLLRFYDPQEGCILLEGRDLREYPREELRKKFGAVFQNDFLMADTLEENILFGREITPEQVEKALVSAQAKDFVEEKEGGLSYLLTTKGQNLSGGQRQRLTIARALVRKPEILILDDSASALDYATDAKLRAALRTLEGNTTTFIVSQRASTIMHADKIIVLDDGEIAGLGTHEELLASCEVYQEIYYSQFEKGGAANA